MADPNTAPAVPNDQPERRKPYRDEAAGRIPTTTGVATIRRRWLTLGALILLVGLTIEFPRHI